MKRLFPFALALLLAFSLVGGGAPGAAGADREERGVLRG